MNSLSALEIRLLDYLEDRLDQQAGVPSYEEMRRALGLTSKDHVFRLLDSLERQGFVQRVPNQRRSLHLVRSSDGRPYRHGRTVRIPLLATIPASFGREVYDGFSPESFLELTRDLVPNDDGIYALQVRGDSMVDAMINHGDIVLMRHQKEARNGDLVAVWLRKEGTSTLKRYFLEGNRVRLQPENHNMSARYLPAQDVEVQGKVVMVIRQFEGRAAA